jgi:hypothetical protein
MRKQQGQPRHHKKNEDLRGVNPLLRGLGGYTRRVRSRAPIETKHHREGLVSLQKIWQNLQASAYTPYEARGLLLGTIIRDTPNTPKHGWKTSSEQTIKTDKRGSSQGLVYQGTRSRLARAWPRAGTVVPGGFTPRPRASTGSGRTLGSPEAKLGQTLSSSDLGQIALPTDRIACAFNAGIA